MSTHPPCPQCDSLYVYHDQNQLLCPECGYEWNPEELLAQESIIVSDANGTALAEGDKVTVVKDLKVKGSSMVIKVGTKAWIRRILDKKDHELDCKVDGVGEMMVTARFVKKACG
ncbi:zinc ribbon domain-containing protein YjdM [Alteromonas oceanisediminis]|uniref:zinc ribbon domain-containing protein YjdM n=1 Tax=Alteromonas oceanisediminis TaxID=2836180 RepID=UPI001BD92F61|nr:zinc ribbon domain-containing protein YjdM [Alteromonas oceanisediminis]MBT0587100.1 alkylphosphonate utilization protein [Alteromonas oceanisediminis]